MQKVDVTINIMKYFVISIKLQVAIVLNYDITI